MFMSVAFVALAGCFVLSGCSDSDDNKKNTDDASALVGVWRNESLGDMDDDKIITTLVIRENGIMTSTSMSEYDEDAYSENYLWDVDGGLFYFAYEDEDQDGVPDLEVGDLKLNVEGLEYELSNSTLRIFIDEEVGMVWEFTKQ